MTPTTCHSPNTAEAEQILQSAFGFAELGLIPDAIKCLNKARATPLPPHLELHEAVLRVQLENERKHYVQAIRAGKRALREFPTSEGLLTNTAIAMNATGDHSGAAKLWRRAIIHGKNTAFARYGLACEETQLGNFRAALKQFAESIAWTRQFDSFAVYDPDLIPLWEHFARARLDLATAADLASPDWESFLEAARTYRGEPKIGHATIRHLDPELAGAVEWLPLQNRFGVSMRPPRGNGSPGYRSRAELEARFRNLQEAIRKTSIANIEKAHERGKAFLLKAQPDLAARELARGDVYAARMHLMEALGAAPWLLPKLAADSRFAALSWLFESLTEAEARQPSFLRDIASITKELRRLQKGDEEWLLSELEERFEANADHPLVLMRKSNINMKFKRADQADLALLIRVCAAWPKDPAAFANAIRLSIRLEEWQVAGRLLTLVPESFALCQDVESLAECVEQKRSDPPDSKLPWRFFGQPGGASVSGVAGKDDSISQPRPLSPESNHHSK